jgi:ribosomal protein L12E/L44/L45/RPP1/RPP2
MSADAARSDSLSERIDRFHRLLDELEVHLDSGFFLSLIGKIVVDEKRIYSVLSELRALRFDLEECCKSEPARPAAAPLPPAAAAAEPAGGTGAEDGQNAGRYAEKIKNGANRYATEVLDNLEQTLQKMMITVTEGKKHLEQRHEREVNADGTTEI